MLLLMLVCCHQNIMAQKKVIDTSAIRQWPMLTKAGDNGAISDDGKYVMITIDSAGSPITILRSTSGDWQYIALYSQWDSFSRDGKKAILKASKDDMSIVTLANKQTEYLANVKQYSIAQSANKDWLVYTMMTGPGVFVRDISSDYVYSFTLLDEILKQQGDNVLAIEHIGIDSIALKIIHLSDQTIAEIWRGKLATNYVFNRKGDQLAFATPGEIWYYRTGMKKAVVLAGKEMKNHWRSGGSLNFSANGRWLFTDLLQPIIGQRLATNGVPINIWNYQDSRLPIQHPSDDSHFLYSLGVIDLQKANQIGSQKIQNLGLDLYRNGKDELLTKPAQIPEDYLIVAHRNGGIHEDWWNPASMPEIDLLSLRDGKRVCLKKSQQSYWGPNFYLSPSGRYVVYFDNLGGKNATLQWYSYEIATGVTQSLTKRAGFPFNVQLDDYDFPLTRYVPYGFGGWLGQDEAVLLKDQYDIWKVELSGSADPVNLTGGSGRKNKIKFDLVDRDDGTNTHDPSWNKTDTILLTAFNKTNKEFGFFQLGLKAPVLRMLAMGPYWYGEYARTSFSNLKSAGPWLFKRETASDAPNWFYTRDWKTVTRLTDLQPQKPYNWLTSELLTWKTFNGKTGQGILYKPENFDSHKKYAVIVHYYEQRSGELNQFKAPTLADGPIDIPYMVSRGYLVFEPDIHYTIGEPGESAYNYIVSGAEYLTKYPFVDKAHIGLQGHSFGGYQTNYIITRSNLFAAAMSASGWANLIGRYGAISVGGGNSSYESREATSEIHRSRIGATLWERPDLYIKNSPIFRVDKIKTPLLLMNNTVDDDVPFFLGVEFFTALRRLKKPAWMLQYEGEGHVLRDEKDKIDFTIRMTQFFDHYLKDVPAPAWMTTEIY